MVEKTQSALTILQQRQSEAATLRTTEEAVADVQVCTLFLPTRNSLWTKTAKFIDVVDTDHSCSGSGEPGNPGGEASGDGGDSGCEISSSST